MYTAVKWLYLIALVVWLGEVVFFSFVVAPGLFRSFPAADAGRAVGAIFPTYYRLGYVCGAVLLITGVVLFNGAGARLWWGVNTVVAAAMLSVTLYAGLVVQPRATELRPQLHAASVAPAIKEEFDRLHRRAVTLNGAVLIGGLVMSAITASALRP